MQHHPNGATTYFAYDVSGRLSEKVTKKDADGSVLVKFAYTRDAAGIPIAINSPCPGHPVARRRR